MKKRLLVAALAACMAFPASLPAQAAGTVHGKKVGWIQEKGQTYYCDPSTLQNVRGKWQLIGKNYYYFDQLGRLMGWKLSRRRQRSPGKKQVDRQIFCR